MDVITADPIATFGRTLVGLVESGGFVFAALAFVAALTVAFCLGRLVERAMTDLRRTAGAPPTE